MKIVITLLLTLALSSILVIPLVFEYSEDGMEIGTLTMPFRLYGELQDPEIVLREEEPKPTTGNSITVNQFQRTIVRYFIDENYPIEKYNETCFKTLIANKTKINKNVSLSIADSIKLNSGKLPYVNKGIKTEIDYTKENIICHNLIVGNYKVGFASSSVNVTVQNTWIMNNSFYNSSRKGIGINLTESLTNATTIAPKLNITGNLSTTPFNNFSWVCDEPVGTNCSVRLRGKIAANQFNTTVFLDFDIGNNTILAPGDDVFTEIKDISYNNNDAFLELQGGGSTQDKIQLVEGRDGTLAVATTSGSGSFHPRVIIPHNINQYPNGTGMTIGFWIFFDNVNLNGGDFLVNKGDFTDGYSIRLDSPATRGFDDFKYDNGVSQDSVPCLLYNFTNQTWAHVTVTYDEVDTIKFYKDGVIIDGCTDTNGIGRLDRTPVFDLRLFILSTSFECQGCTMDDFFFAQRNYSQQEIQNYMNGTHYYQVIKERNYTSPILLGQSANYSIIDAKFFLESNTGNIPYVLNATYGYGGFPVPVVPPVEVPEINWTERFDWLNSNQSDEMCVLHRTNVASGLYTETPNCLHSLMNMYELTGDLKYLTNADRQLENISARYTEWGTMTEATFRFGHIGGAYARFIYEANRSGDATLQARGSYYLEFINENITSKIGDNFREFIYNGKNVGMLVDNISSDNTTVHPFNQQYGFALMNIYLYNITKNATYYDRGLRIALAFNETFSYGDCNYDNDRKCLNTSYRFNYTQSWENYSGTTFGFPPAKEEWNYFEQKTEIMYRWWKHGFLRNSTLERLSNSIYFDQYIQEGNLTNVLMSRDVGFATTTFSDFHGLYLTHGTYTIPYYAVFIQNISNISVAIMNFTYNVVDDGDSTYTFNQEPYATILDPRTDTAGTFHVVPLGNVTSDQLMKYISTYLYFTDGEAVILDEFPVPGDTCDCTSLQAGTTVDCSENCEIEACDAEGQDILIEGTGNILISGDITNYGTVDIIGTDSNNMCEVDCIGGCFA